MLKQEKILTLHKNSFFKKYKKNTKKRNKWLPRSKRIQKQQICRIFFKKYKIMFKLFKLNIHSLKSSKLVFLKKIILIDKEFKNSNNIKKFTNIYKLKSNFKKLLINIVFKRKKFKNNRKNDIDHNRRMNFGLFIFFVKKIKDSLMLNDKFLIQIKIKKNMKKYKYYKKYKKPFLYWKVFKVIRLFSRIHFFIFKKKIKILLVYNKSHSKRPFKLKKKRRK